MIALLQNMAIVILMDTDSSKSVLVLDLSYKVKNLIVNLRARLMIEITSDIRREYILPLDISELFRFESICFYINYLLLFLPCSIVANTH